jgi:copper(I)-binding protein
MVRKSGAGIAAVTAKPANRRSGSATPGSTGVREENPSMRIAIAAAFAAGIAMAGAAAQPGEAPGRIEIGQPWARATPGAARVGAVYLTIRSAAGDRLLSASSPVAAAELNESAMAGMVMNMRRLTGVALPAGQRVAVAPGGMHMMLVGLKAPLREGQSFPLTLTFAKAGRQTVTVVVGKVGTMGPPPPAH